MHVHELPTLYYSFSHKEPNRAKSHIRILNYVHFH